MRFPPFLLLPVLTVLLARPAAAQEQERKLMDRIEKPDMTVSFGAQKKSFFGGKNFEGAGSARVRSYSMEKTFRAKDYLTGSYSGQKGFWMGDFKFASKDADTEGRGAAKRLAKAHPVKAMPVEDWHDAGKTVATRAVPARSTEFKGRSQDKIDLQGPQALDSIRDGTFSELKTIDDIRNLLNKNE